MPQEFLPLLKPENIDELKSLILQIMEDNDSKLEKIIENRQNRAIQQGEDFTIEDLNDLLSQQCLQKQKIISNLSHFSLSLMNTIDVLWQDNEDLQYRVKDQQDFMEQMNNHMQELSKQTQFLKNKLHLAYNDMHKIEEEKQQVEEYLSSIIVKHDSSFCLNRSRKLHDVNEEEKRFEENLLQEEPEMYFTGNQMINHETQVQNYAQQVQFERECQQNAQPMFNKQNRDLANRKISEIDLLQESVIKDSISVLRRFTLSDQVEQNLPALQESHQDIHFINKSNRFSLINQISLQIFQQPKQKHTYQEEPITHHSFIQAPSFERSFVRELRISNEKVNITIGTGTEFTKTRDSEKNGFEQFSLLNPTLSCASFMLHRQNSAVMYPSLERSSSSISFVTHTTKHIQTDPPKPQNSKPKETKNIEKKSIGIDTSSITDKSIVSKKNPEKSSNFARQKSGISKKQSQKSEQNGSRKSFGQLLDYFTKKIVSDRIKTGNKKNDFGAFKKTKSNIQKIF